MIGITSNLITNQSVLTTGLKKSPKAEIYRVFGGGMSIDIIISINFITRVLIAS